MMRMSHQDSWKSRTQEYQVCASRQIFTILKNALEMFFWIENITIVALSIGTAISHYLLIREESPWILLTNIRFITTWIGLVSIVKNKWKQKMNELFGRERFYETVQVRILDTITCESVYFMKIASLWQSIIYEIHALILSWTGCCLNLTK